MKRLQDNIDIVLKELALQSVENKADFVDLLSECGIVCTITDGSDVLVEKFVDSAPNNHELLIGAAMLSADHSSSSFDADSMNDQVIGRYETLREFFSTEETDPTEFSNLGGISAAIEAVGNAASSGMELRNKKRYAGQDLAKSQMEAKQKMYDTVIALKQAELSKKNIGSGLPKTKKVNTTTIVVASVAGVLLIGLIVYAVKSRKKG